MNIFFANNYCEFGSLAASGVFMLGLGVLIIGLIKFGDRVVAAFGKKEG
jgi:hypothetical protein